MKVFNSQPEDKMEISSMMSFRHENIVKVFAAGIMREGAAKDRYVMVMELCSHGALDVFLRDNHPNGLDDENFVRLVECISNAYEYLRTKNILHRDIKPANILVCESEEGKFYFKLADFGTACKSQYGDRWTPHQYIAGTPLYWHPRINAFSSDNHDSALSTTTDKTYIDLWSIGATFYEAATGKRAIRPLLKNQRQKKGGNLRNDLQAAYERMRPGVISIEEINEGEWHQYTQLPADIQMSKCLAQMITPLLAHLMGKTKEEIKSVDFLFGYSSAIVQTKDYRAVSSLLAQSLDEIGLLRETNGRLHADMIDLTMNLSQAMDENTKLRKQETEMIERINALEENLRRLETSYIPFPFSADETKSGKFKKRSATLPIHERSQSMEPSRSQALNGTPKPPFKLPPSPNVQRTMHLYKSNGMSPICCNSFGRYEQIDWNKMNENSHWKHQWTNLLTKGEGWALHTPPLILPLEYGECVIEFCILWLNNHLVLRGTINSVQWLDCPEVKKVDAQICVKINGKISRDRKVFKLMKSGWIHLFNISNDLKNEWEAPTVDVIVFPLKESVQKWKK